MSQPSERVAVTCPSCSPDVETVHEVLKPGGQTTVRCTECGHVHKTRIEAENTVEKDVVVSQDGESFSTIVEVPASESVTVGEEFIAETDEAIFVVRVTSLASVVAIGGFSIQLSQGDVIRIEAVGSEIRWLLNSEVIETLSDATYSTGKPGIYFLSELTYSTNPAEFDSFACGDIFDGVLLGVKVDGTPGHAFHFERDDGSVIALVEFGGKVRAFLVGEREWTA